MQKNKGHAVGSHAPDFKVGMLVCGKDVVSFVGKPAQ